MDHELRTFSPQEVNQLIPVLTPLLFKLREKQDRAVKLEAQIDALEIISDDSNENAVKELRRLTEAHHKEATEFYSVIESIHQKGCLVKDVEKGLVDFYSVIDGKVVYLCWMLGEPQVTHWHEVGQGFGQRQPLPIKPS